MKHWMESRQVFEAIARLQARGVAAALATVIRVRGSAYRHEGAKLLVGADGTIVGNVSGGCLELDVREVALRVLRNGVAERRHYCGGADEVAAWDLGVGCEGEVELYIEPIVGVRARELAMMAEGGPFHVRTALGDGQREVRPGPARAGIVHDADGAEWFVDGFTPPPCLLICGAGDDAMPLARLATEVGFAVVVTDRRPGLLTAERFPVAVRRLAAQPRDLASRCALDAETFAVVMAHHFVDDGVYLGVLLDSAVAYIGVLGPRQRTDRLLAGHHAVGRAHDARVHGPVGLDIGTDGAEQVAIAVLAEVMAVRTGRAARPLRERRSPIHADAD